MGRFGAVSRARRPGRVGHFTSTSHGQTNMASNKELTGGTGDVNPQWLTSITTQSGNDVSTQLEVALPIPRVSAKTGRTTVLEVLRMQFILADISATPAASFVSCVVGTNSATIGLASANAFAVFLLDIANSTATGVNITDSVFQQDLSDGAGHGFLIGTDNIYVTLNSAATAAINSMVVKLLYRYKEVTLAEYIGIVQGQQ